MTLMRCTIPHWQGNTFVARGLVLPAGHPDVIPEFFEVYDVGGDAAPTTPPEAPVRPRGRPGKNP